MSSMVGADVEALRRLALQFDQSAQRLRGIAGSVSNGVQASAWVGPVAVRFRHSWDSEHSVRLRNVAEVLDTNAKVLRQNAAQQEAASASLSGNAGSSVIARQQAENAGGARTPSPLDRFVGFWGPVATAVAGAIPFAADVGDFLSQLANLKNLAPTLGPLFQTAGKVLGPLAIVGGLYSVVTAGDGYQLADGVISTAIGVAATVGAFATLATPVGIGIAGVAVIWGAAQLLSGDVPVTKRVVDFGASVARGAGQAASQVAGAVSSAARAVSEAPARIIRNVLRVPRIRFGF